MKNGFRINSLQSHRYSVTYGNNEQMRFELLREGGINAYSMQISYNELIKQNLSTYENCKPDALPTTLTQTSKNRLSALHSYLAFNGKTESSFVGQEMYDDFDKRLHSYLASLSLSDKSKIDRRSLLRSWQRAALLFKERKNALSVNHQRSGTTTPFHIELRTAFANHPDKPKTVAIKAGASTSAVQRWLNGALPNKRALPSLARIEAALGLERSSLSRLLPKQTAAVQPSVPSRISTIPYRVSLAQRVVDEYRIKSAELTPEFCNEWRCLLDYKTSKFPSLKRSAKGKWRLLPQEKLASKVSAISSKGKLYCVTSDMELNQIRGFLGYLVRPKTKGGFDVDDGSTHTLAWLAVSSAVDGFMEFLRERANGSTNAGHARFATFVRCLTDPVTGWLTQQPHLRNNLPGIYAKKPWEEMCADAHRLALGWKNDAVEMSRKPTTPIQQLLDLEEPLSPILRVVTALDTEAKSYAPGSLQEAVCKRDALLLAMLIANPLRRRNFVLLTWLEDSTGNLYMRENGQWRLRFDAKDFKNESGAKNEQYDAPLPKALTERISEYLAEYRPRILKGNADVPWLFPGKYGTKWENLSIHVACLTKRWIPGSPGFGTHALRHLIATDYLRKNPGDFLTAAELLHDRLETVLRSYAHLRQDDSFGKYEQHLSRINF
jgi:integrase